MAALTLAGFPVVLHEALLPLAVDPLEGVHSESVHVAVVLGDANVIEHMRELGANATKLSGGFVGHIAKH